MPPNYNTIAFECAMSNIAIPHANGDYAYASFAMSEYYDDMVVQGPCSIVLEFYYLLPSLNYDKWED
jgi:hydroxyacyl-ACP dehydratase HTD2-like protein with hotdog domain